MRGAARSSKLARGAAEIEAARAHIGWNHPPFHVPADIYAAWDARTKGASLEAQWNAAFAAYRAAHPELAADPRVHRLAFASVFAAAPAAR